MPAFNRLADNKLMPRFKHPIARHRPFQTSRGHLPIDLAPCIIHPLRKHRSRPHRKLGCGECCAGYWPTIWRYYYTSQALILNTSGRENRVSHHHASAMSSLVSCTQNLAQYSRGLLDLSVQRHPASRIAALWPRRVIDEQVPCLVFPVAPPSSLGSINYTMHTACRRGGSS